MTLHKLGLSPSNLDYASPTTAAASKQEAAAAISVVRDSDKQ